MTIVRLPKSGTYVLTSDACYLPENLAKDILPSIGLTYDPSEMLNGYAYIKRVRDMEKGRCSWPTTRRLQVAKHSPEYYE